MQLMIILQQPLRFLPVAVVVVFVITSQGGEAAQADGIREKNLGSSIHPYLKKRIESLMHIHALKYI